MHSIGQNFWHLMIINSKKETVYDPRAQISAEDLVVIKSKGNFSVCGRQTNKRNFLKAYRAIDQDQF